jgi:hypothetical protein
MYDIPQVELPGSFGLGGFDKTERFRTQITHQQRIRTIGASNGYQAESGGLKYPGKINSCDEAEYSYDSLGGE